MINVLLSGCNGKMGQVISSLAAEREDLKVAAGFDIIGKKVFDYPVYTDLDKIKDNVDVIIDFSHPDNLTKLLDYSMKRKIPILVATTGLTKHDVAKLKEHSSKVAVFYSANMSLGVNLLIDLVQKASRVLGYNFDVEIVEKHHNLKIDAPSGTALALADAINHTFDDSMEYTYDRHSRRKKRAVREIGIHAVRGGTIVGEHSVIFAGKDEIIELNHMALSKSVFAVGALNAAGFLSRKKAGFYSMKELIDEC